MFEGSAVWEQDLAWSCVYRDHGKRSRVQTTSLPPFSFFLSFTDRSLHISSSLPSLFVHASPPCVLWLCPSTFFSIISPSPLYSFFMLTPPLRSGFVSQIYQSPSRGMLLAASLHLLLWHSHAGSLWVGLKERRSQPRKWTRKFSQEFSFFYMQPRLCRNSFIAALFLLAPKLSKLIF